MQQQQRLKQQQQALLQQSLLHQQSLYHHPGLLAPPQKKVPVLPWMRSPIDVTLFQECPLRLLPCLDPRLELALKNMGFSSLFPVQVAVWHETVGPGAFEQDLCINSPTGSGKTLAYALPIVNMMSSCAVKCLRALVVLPTRDLALQEVGRKLRHIIWNHGNIHDN